MSNKYLFHHCTGLDAVQYNEVKYRISNGIFSTYYRILARIWAGKDNNWKGFYPHFFSVGSFYKNDVIEMTGYPFQFISPSSKFKPKNLPNNVLFSFDKLDGIFTDYQWWEELICMNYDKTYLNLSNSHRRWLWKRIFRPSLRSQNQWFKHAKNSFRVQFITKNIDFRKAKCVYCRNRDTKRKLEKMGFQNVNILKYREKSTYEFSRTTT